MKDEMDEAIEILLEVAGIIAMVFMAVCIVALFAGFDTSLLGGG